MKATMSILFLAAALFSLPNDLRSERWYSSISAGKSNSLNGSYEIENFYSPGWSYSLDFGFRVNPYVLILPASFTWGEFGFSIGNYTSNYWSNFDYISQERSAWKGRHGIITSIDEDYIHKNFSYSSKSSFEYFSYIPGIIFYSPEFMGFKGFASVGSGVSFSHLFIQNLFTYNNPNRSPLPFTRRKNKSYLNMRYSGGMEYGLFDNFGLLLEMRYNVVYSGRENPDLSLEDEIIHLDNNPLLFYYMTPDGLKIHRFMEEKDLKTFDIRYGMTFRF